MFLELMVSKSQWCAVIYTIHKSAYYVSIFLSRNDSQYLQEVEGCEISVIVPKTNLLIYLVPPRHASINMFVEHKPNHVILKFINDFKDNSAQE